MANPYNDPRYAMAQAMRQQKQASTAVTPLGPAPSASAVAYGRQASNMAASNPSLRDAIAAIGQGKKSTAPKGGIMGTVLGNPITQGVLKPLGVLAMPGKAVVSTLREGLDAIDGNANTKASFGDLTKQIKDPSFGFGKAFKIDTGNKWLDRAIGFVGDVATDPLTYVTFGAGKFAGYAGKLDLAEAVLKHTGDEALSAAVARSGRAAIKNNELLTQLGANRHGLYMFGKRLKVGEMQQGLRIPGTAAIGQMSENGIAKLRLLGSNTRMGAFVQKITLPADDLAARQALLRGATAGGAPVSDKTSAALIGYFTSNPLQRRVAGEVLQVERQNLMQILQSEGAQGLNAYKDSIYKYLENPALLASAPADVQQAAKVWGAGFFDTYENKINEALRAVDPSAELKPIENYFPHIQTDEAIAYRANPNSPHVRELNNIYARDPMEGGKNFKTRTMQVGDDWFGHKLTIEDIKSTERLNELASAGGFAGNFFETDISKVATRYVEEYAKEAGVIAKHKHLADAGFWERAQEIEAGTSFVDGELVKNIKKNVKTISSDLRDAHQNLSKSWLGLSSAVAEQQAALTKQLADLTSPTGALGSRELLLSTEAALNDILSNSMNIGADQLSLVGAAIGNSKNKMAELFGYEYKAGKLVAKDTGLEVVDSPHVLGGLTNYLDNLQQEALSLEHAMRPLEQDLTGVALQDAYKTSEIQMKLLQQKLEQTSAKVEQIVAFGNQLEDSLQKVINGEIVGDVGNDVINVLGVIGADGVLSNSYAREVIGGQFDVGQSLQKFLTGEVNKDGGLFSELTSVTPIPKDTVTKMPISQYYDNMSRVFTGEMPLSDVRSMGMFALLNDSRIYGDNVPGFLQNVRNELITQLRQADEVQSILKDIATQQNAGGRLTARKLFESEITPAYNRALLYTEQSKGMTDWLGKFKSTEVGLKSLDSPIDWAVVDKYVEANPWLADFTPTATYGSAIEDLMGSNVPNAEYLADRLNTAGGSQFTPPATYGELVSQVEEALYKKELLLNEKFFEFGSGVGSKSYTGKELVDTHTKIQSINDEIQRLRAKKATGLRSQLDRLGYNKQDIATMAGREQRAAIAEQAKFLSLSKEDSAKYAQLVQARNDLTGGGTRINPNWFVDGTTSRQSLGNALTNYTMVSEVNSRWAAVTAMLGVHGLAPTEKMFTQITENVGKKFIPVIEQNLHDARNAIGLLTRLDSEMAAKLSEGGAGVTAGKIFADHMNSLSVKEFDTLTAAIGSKTMAAADPYSMLRRRLSVMATGTTRAEKTALENQFLEETVRPWFEAAFPNKTPTKTRMMTALRNEVSSTSKGARSTLMTAWSETADANMVKRWFEDHIGVSAIQAKSSTVSGRVGESGGEGFRRITGGNNLLDVKIKNLQEARIRFKRMLSPDMNIAEFFNDPSAVQRTPTFYAYMLQKEADTLAERIAVKESASEAAGIIVERVKSAKATAATYKSEADLLAAGVKVPDNFVAKLDAIKPRIKAIESADSAVEAAQSKVEDVLARSKQLQDSITAKNEAWTASGKKGKRPLTNTESTNIPRLKSELTSAKKGVVEAQKVRSAIPNLSKGESGFYGIVKTEMSRPAPDRVVTRRANTITGQGERSVAGVIDRPYADQAKKSLDEYNALVESTMHSKAKADQEIVNAIDTLAGHELPAYRYGFVDPQGRVVKLKNGEVLTFTEAEHKSLYTGPGGRVRNQVLRENADAAIRDTRGQIEKLGALKQQYQETLARTYTLKLSANDVSALQQEIVSIESKLVGLNKDLAGFAVDREASLASTQAMALEKMRILVNGSKTSGAVFDQNGLSQFGKFEHATQANIVSRVSPGRSVFDYFDSNPRYGASAKESARRQSAIAKAWADTPEFKYLEKLSVKEKDVFVRMYQDMTSRTESMLAHQQQLVAQANRAVADSATAGHAVVEAQKSVAEAADVAADRLAVTTGSAPIDDMGNPLPQPTTPLEAKLYSESIEQQATPNGPVAAPATGMENTVLAQAADARVSAEGARNQAYVQTKQAEAELKAWNTPRVGPLGEKLPSPRAEAMNTARGIYKAKLDRTKAVQDVVAAATGAREDIRVQIEITSGGAAEFMTAINSERELAAALRSQLDDIGVLVRTLPPKDAVDVMKSLAKTKGSKLTPERIGYALQTYRDWSVDNFHVFEKLSADPQNPVFKAWAAAGIADAHLIDLEMTHWKELINLEAASTPEWISRVIKPAGDELNKWVAEAKKNGMISGKQLVDARRFPSLYGNTEAVDLLNGIARINKPGIAMDLGKFMSGYTGFFKAYATLSPGFHIRNEISNIFSMFAAGAEISNMREGFKLWRMMDQHLGQGGNLESFVNLLPDAQKQFGRDSGSIMLGMAGGKTQDALEGFMREGSKLTSNRALSGSQKIGGKLEGSAHFMLAYDSLVKGFSVDHAFNRTKRYLFDYSQKSLLDEAMKDIVPFWTWMSRNLPLQIVNRWANPKPYLMYQRVVSNMNAGQDDSQTPGYLQNAINLGNNKYINPDLPFSRVNEQIDQLSDPRKLLGYLNPGIRVPIEMLTNANTYTGKPYEKTFVKLDGTRSVYLPFLQAAGQVKYDSAGNAVATAKSIAAIEGTVPFLNQAERVGSKGWNSWFGLPYTQATGAQIAGANFGKLEQLQALAAQQANIQKAK